MPHNVTVSTDTTTGSVSNTVPYTYNPPASGPAIINAGLVSTWLTNGSGVVIPTGSDGGDAGDIAVIAAVDGSTGSGSLQLQAAHSVALQASVQIGPTATLTLTAQTGSVSQSAGVVGAGSLNVSASGAVMLTSAGNTVATLTGLTAGGDAALVDSAALSVSGPVNVGVGSVTLTTSTGDLTVNGLVTAGSATLLSQTGAVNLGVSGSLVVSNSLSISAGGAAPSFLNGTITGSGTLTLSALGDINLGGNSNGFSGAVVVASGRVLTPSTSALSASQAVTVVGGATLGLIGNETVGSLAGTGIVQAIAQSANLTAGALGSSSFSGVLQDESSSNVLSLTKAGTGVLTVTGANTFTGATTVSAGALAVDGAFASAITVQSGATLRGTGTDSAAVTVLSGGTFAPGEGAGTFTSSTLQVSGTFAETIAAGGAFEQARVTAVAAGVVNLAGSTLQLNYTGGAEAYGTAYAIIQAVGGGGAGTVSGTFSNASTTGSTILSNGHTFRVDYGLNAVTLTDVTNTAPTVAGTHASMTSDRATDTLFSGVTVTDPDVGQTETATISFAAANGTLAGAGAGVTAGGVSTYTVSAGSASALQTVLQAVTFAPTQAPAGAAATQTTFTLSVSDGTVATAADTGTVVTATHTTNTPVATANGSAGPAITDKVTTAPFAAVTVTDPDSGQTETATVTYTAGNGTLSGAGLTGQAGSYGLSASSAQALQSALQALVFTPTMNQVAPGQTVTTGFTVAVTDGSSQAQTTDTVTTASVNDAPALGGLQASATAPAAGSVVLQPGLTITDPDANASATSAQVVISAGFVAGDRLTVTPAAGLTGAYDAATGVLTLSGAASDAAYQQTLRSVAFSHDGAVSAGARTVGFTVTDDQGVASATANETVGVGGYSPPSTTSPTQTPSQQAGFTTQTDNLIRVAPNDPALSDPTSPINAQAQAGAQIAARFDTGQLSAQDAQSALYHLVDGTISVAEIDYAFFTGRTPTAAGLNYLVHSSANPTDLNDPYYAQFTTENRYINFAANLATGVGAGTAAFQANYGSLSLSDATAKAYQMIFGAAPAAGKIDAILSAQVSNGLGGTETRAQYFSDITGGSAAAQKAAAIGFLLADSVKEGFGSYQQADLHFLQDLAHGTAAFNVDLLAAYGQAPNLVGQPTADQSLIGS